MRISGDVFRMQRYNLTAFVAIVSLLLLTSPLVRSQPTLPKHAGKFADSLISRTADFTSNHPGERVYMVFDRDVYAMGEQAQFSALVLDAASPETSMISRVLYVDWIHPSGEISKRQRLPVENGRATGAITFNDTFLPGAYTVRAYTNVMRNLYQSAFYYQHVPVINAVQPARDTAGTEGANPLTMQPGVVSNVLFYPEGGTLLSGVKSLVAFRAVDAKGRGTDFEGTLIDDHGKTIATVRSSHRGMGAFPLIASAGSTYRLQLAGGESYLLPPSREGVALSAANINAQSVQVKIATNKVSDQHVYLFGRVGGVVCYSAYVKLSAAEQLLSIPKRGLPDGILQLYLVNANGEAICERSVFLRPHNEGKLRVTTRRSASSLDSLVISISNSGGPLDSASALTMRVTTGTSAKSDLRVRVDSEFYLRSRLKGFVNEPDWYFENNTRASRYALDLVMLTHSLNEPSWKEILDNDPWIFEIETGINLAGEIRVGDKPARNATFAIAVPRGDAQAFNVFETDSAGRFRIDNVNFSDTIATYWKLMGRNNKVRGDLFVRLDSLAAPPAVDKMYLSAYDPLAVDKFRVRYPSGYDEMQRLTDGATILDEVVVDASRMNIRHFRGNYVVKPDERDIKNKVSTAAFVARYVIGLNFASMVVDKDGDMAWGVPYLGKVVPIGSVFVDGVEYETKGAAGNPLYILQAIPIEEVDRVLATRAGFAIWTKRARFQEGAVKVTLQGYDQAGDTGSSARFVFDPDNNGSQTLYWQTYLQFDETGSAMSRIFCPAQIGPIQVDINGVIHRATVDDRVVISP